MPGTCRQASEHCHEESDLSRYGRIRTLGCRFQEEVLETESELRRISLGEPYFGPSSEAPKP